MSGAGDSAIRFSYCMLPDYPMADQIEMIKVADECGFYACYAVDETWHKDLWTMFAAAAGQDRSDPVRPERHSRVPARADADLPAACDARRDLRRPRRGGRLNRQLRDDAAVPHRLGQAQAAVATARGDARDAHLPRRRQDRLRRGLLPLHRTVDGRAAGAGADPAEDRRDEGPAVVRARGRDRRRHAPRAVVLAGGVRVRDRARQDRRGGAAVATRSLRTWAPGSCRSSPRIRRRRSEPRGSWWRSTSHRCRPSSSPATASTKPTFSRSSTRSRPATWPRRSRCSAPRWPRSCRSPERPRSAPSRSSATSCHRVSTM